jgi:hypothetical protein
MAAVHIVMERAVPIAFLLLVLACAAIPLLHVLRRRQDEYELLVSPSELRLVSRSDPTVRVLARGRAGHLIAAESGMDPTESLVAVTDDGGRVVFRVRSSPANLRFGDTSAAPPGWWADSMPAGTSPKDPPTTARTVTLLASWWPTRERRVSLRGTAGLRRRWLEGDLRTEGSAVRRGRRFAWAMVVGLIIFIVALMVPTTWPWTTTEVVAFVPPIVAALVLATRSIVRR